MDIPFWVWALGLIGLISIYEHFSDKKEQKDRTKNESVNSTIARPVSLVSQNNSVTAKQYNRWDGKINGRMVTQGSAWDLLRKDTLKRDGYKCTNCGRTSNLTVDHKVPLSLGGTNIKSNLTTLCKDCHEHKDQRKIFDKAFDAKDNYGEDHTLTRKVAALSKAINASQSISVTYTDYKGKKTARSISPRQLVKDKGRIYCIAYCHLRNAKRTFRLSRIEI